MKKRSIEGIGIIQYSDGTRYIFWEGVELMEFQAFVNTWNIRKPVSQGFILNEFALNAGVPAKTVTPADLHPYGCSIFYPQTYFSETP